MEVPPDLLRARGKWKWVGRQRPPWADAPGPGEVSVWDFARPPTIEPEPRRLVVEQGGERVAESDRAVRVLETASPPTLYVPIADVRPDALRPSATTSLCEWKGRALHFDVRGARDAAWRYPDPFPDFESLVGFVAFHPARLDLCSLDGVRALPQPGAYYGGWVTPELAGPFKGAPGTEDW